MAKFIFVTGGVVSGLGKGITTASVGLLLKAGGGKVDAVKFDPYLNIDPGTMSPYEHGEVFVLDDGSETDLDLGHYERFLEVNLTKNSSVTSGKIYDAILTKERNGDFLGKNVQLIPNITNYIKEKFVQGIDLNDPNVVRLIEIGGSSGDMEAEVFLESFRQFKQEFGKNVWHIHLGFVPFLKCSDEYKSKPFQNSIRELLKSGLQPDILVARYYPERKRKLHDTLLSKLALFGNLPQKNVINLPDLESIYQVPVFIQNQTSLPMLLNEFLDEEISPTLSNFYDKIVDYNKQDFPEIKIGIIAKYPKLSDAYLSLLESLKIAAIQQNLKLKPIFIDAEKLEKGKKFSENEFKKLTEIQGMVVPGGFGVRGMEGKIKAVKYARENKIPFLGICLGLQMAVVEFARNVCSIKAASREMQENAVNQDYNDSNFVIDYIPEQKHIYKKGGTMRLGGYDCKLQKDSIAYKLFGQSQIRERHRHRLEVQDQFLEKIESKGFTVSGKHFFKDKKTGKSKFLVEIMELEKTQHPYFIGTQSHPEFLSRPSTAHPLFSGLVKAASKIVAN